MTTASNDWDLDCIRWYGKILSGKYSHWCWEWDELPIDETCAEFSCCTCFSDDPEAKRLSDEITQRLTVQYLKLLAAEKNSS